MKYHHGKFEVICKNCGKKYKVYYCELKRTRFCSKQCQGSFYGKFFGFRVNKVFNTGRTRFKKGRIMSIKEKEKHSKAMKGKKFSEKHRRKLSEVNKGERSSNWKGGITPENIKIRMGIEYHLWRETVFTRDNFTCQKCGKRGGRLNAHHIFNFATYLYLRFAIDNGITFCEKCHRKFHRKYSKKNNTKDQLIKFLKD